MKNKSILAKNILDNKVPRQIIGLLLKQDMSPSDLAEDIYGKKNVRSGILDWLVKLDKEKLIERADKGVITGNKKLFRAKLKIIADFTKEEEKFVKLCIERFWNPIRANPINSVNEFLIEMFVIKKIYKFKKTLAGYNPSSDLEKFKKMKNEKLQIEFLDKLTKKGSDKFTKKILKDGQTNRINIRRDFILMSLLIPDSIQSKLTGGHNVIGTPLFMTMTLLDN
jgi:hypothetical protein